MASVGEVYVSNVDPRAAQKIAKRATVTTQLRRVVNGSGLNTTERIGEDERVLEVSIDLPRLLRELGKKALNSKGGRAAEASGAVVVKVVR